MNSWIHAHRQGSSKMGIIFCYCCCYLCVFVRFIVARKEYPHRKSQHQKCCADTISFSTKNVLNDNAKIGDRFMWIRTGGIVYSCQICKPVYRRKEKDKKCSMEFRKCNLLPCFKPNLITCTLFYWRTIQST